jgi:hypothetical protein
MAKIKVTEENLLNWYFSDSDDILIFGRNIISELQKEGKSKWTVQDVLSICDYIPGFITENGEDDKEYNPKEVELIK